MVRTRKKIKSSRKGRRNTGKGNVRKHCSDMPNVAGSLRADVGTRKMDGKKGLTISKAPIGEKGGNRLRYCQD